MMNMMTTLMTVTIRPKWLNVHYSPTRVCWFPLRETLKSSLEHYDYAQYDATKPVFLLQIFPRSLSLSACPFSWPPSSVFPPTHSLSKRISSGYQSNELASKWTSADNVSKHIAINNSPTDVDVYCSAIQCILYSRSPEWTHRKLPTVCARRLQRWNGLSAWEEEAMQLEKKSQKYRRGVILFGRNAIWKENRLDM